MIETSGVETLTDSILELVDQDVPTAVVSNHVTLVLSGWTHRVRSPEQRAAFNSACTGLAGRLDQERAKLSHAAAAAKDGRARMLLARAQALAAGREAALAVTSEAAASTAPSDR